MVNQTNFQIFDQALKSAGRPTITIPSNIPSGISANSIPALLVDRTILLLTATYIYQITNPVTFTGKIIKESPTEEMRVCRKDDFDEGVFQKIGMKGGFCRNSKNYTLSGYNDEPEIQFMRLTLERCTNTGIYIYELVHWCILNLPYIQNIHHSFL